MSLDIISANEIDKYIGKQNVRIIDLRNKILYEQGHIPTAINIPYKEFEKRINEIPKYTDLILYCERGNLSQMLGRKLSQSGYEVKSLYGGMLAYNGRIEK